MIVEPAELDLCERRILEHSLKGRADCVFRNYFAANVKASDGYTCMKLVSKGLMVQGRRLSDNVELHYFHVTQAGAEAIGLHLPRE